MDDVKREEMKCCKCCKCFMPLSAFGMNRRKRYADRKSNYCIPCDEVRAQIQNKELAERRKKSRSKEDKAKKKAKKIYMQEWNRKNPNYMKKWKDKNPEYHRKRKIRLENAHTDFKKEVDMVQYKAQEFLTSDLMRDDLRAYYESEDFKREPVPYRESERFRMLAEAFAMDWANNLA